jgi:hypothetical protein
MRQIRLLSLSLAFTLLGCQVPLNLPHATIPAAQGPDGSALGPTDTAAPRMGTLLFAIRWPERDLPGFSAQVIPLSTETIHFELWKPGDTLDMKPLESQVIRRTTGSAISSTTLSLPVGTGYTARARAYDADGLMIASATKPGCEVVWGKSSPVAITLGASFAPQIANLHVKDGLLTQAHGTPGQALTITGINLDRAPNPIVIFPSGIEAAATYQAPELTVTIPPGAGSGDLHLKIDGVKSENGAPFQEVRSLELSADEEGQGGQRDGDGAIATWLGDSFPIRIKGTDTAGMDVEKPAVTGWNLPADGVGEMLANDAYHALTLGKSTLTVRMHELSSSRAIVVAPPAGTIHRPADVAADVVQGLTDHSLTPLGDKWLVAWHNPATSKVYWRLIDKNGLPLGAAHETTAIGSGAERAVRVAAVPAHADPVNPGEMVPDTAFLAYRAVLGGRNMVVFQPLDPLTGAKRGDGKALSFSTAYDSDGLVDLVANDEGYALAIQRFTGTHYVQRLHTFRYRPETPTASESYPLTATRTYTRGTNNEVMYYPPSEDTFSVAPSGNRFVIARHFGTSGGAGPTALEIEHTNLDQTPVKPAQAFLHDRNRVVSVATDGTVILATAMEVLPSGTIIKLYRYDMELEQQGLGVTIATLGIAGSDPVNWPLKLVWDGKQFLLSYARMVGTLEDGQLVQRPQAMIQAINKDGTLDGPAYPMAKVSQVPTLYPTAEGGMALWLNSARMLYMRRMKFR